MPRPYVNLKNKKFGFLKVIRRIDNKKGKPIWLCKCLCGKLVQAYSYNLLGGRNKSCGCGRIGKNNPRFCGFQDLTGKYWSSIKNRAKKKKQKFSISMEYVWSVFEKQNKKCALSNLPISFGFTSKTNTASIDRIDSNFGYIIGNIQIVHKDINCMKFDFKQQYFIYLCKEIAKSN